MRYIVITTDGEFVDQDRPGRAHELINGEVGEPGYDIAIGGPAVGIFVNDMGHVTGLPRNVVGTCLASSIAMQPVSLLAGPVVITGWEVRDPLSDESETCSLDDEGVRVLRVVHRDIRIVLGAEQGELSPDAHEAWQGAMREVAEHAASGPRPTVEVLSGIDALDYLLGRRP